ncbi:MAG TPA: DUF2339 domain-containing protein, partial [Anaeromyxobacteraceae bacterium]|nr:DUF2339 domain-containing protein [Anaeromyxobacteraceae bacterium]
MDTAVMLVLLAAGLVLGPWALGFAALRRARRAEERLAALEARVGAALPPPLPVWEAQQAEPIAATHAPSPQPAVAPSAPAPATPSSPPTAPPPDSLEERLALVWFTRAGAATFLLGAAWFFKFAVDNAWIGPAGRVAIGALTGAALLALGEARCERLRAPYLHALLGTGLALLFVATYASHALYHLVPAPAAFAAAAVVALLGGALALRHRGARVLAAARAGGLLAPVLLSTGEDRPAALFA